MKLGLTLLFLLLSTGIFAQYGGGATSSKQIKKTILKSFLFRNSDIFYADGLPENPMDFPIISNKRIKKLGKEINKLIKILAKSDNKIENLLRGKFNEVNVDVKLNKVKFYQEEGNTFFTSNQGTLFMDVKVIQSIFQAAIIESVIERDPWGDPQDEGMEDSEKLRSFFEFKGRVKQTKTFGMIGDLLSGLDSPWFEMNDFVEVSDEIEKRYLSTLLFAIAHEQGHLGLKHFDLPRAEEQQERHRREFEADAYAFWMMTYIFQGQLLLDNLGFSGFQNYDFRALIGDQTLFDKAFYLANFKWNEELHPSVESRKVRIQEIFETL